MSPDTLASGLRHTDGRNTVEFTCDGCGGVVAELPVAQVRGQPETARTLVSQAQRGHVCERGAA